MAVSPDGARVVYVGRDGGQNLLYLRELDERDAVPLRGAEGAVNPFFSPDGEWVGFFVSGRAGELRKVPVGGGSGRHDRRRRRAAWCIVDAGRHHCVRHPG